MMSRIQVCCKLALIRKQMASNKEAVKFAAETCKFVKPTKFNVMYN